MNINELQNLITKKKIDRIVFFRPSVMKGYQPDGWEIWGYFGSVFIDLDNRLLDDDKNPVMFNSIDYARRMIRELGYAGVIEIDG